MKKYDSKFIQKLNDLIKNQEKYKSGKSLGSYYKEIISYCASRI